MNSKTLLLGLQLISRRISARTPELAEAMKVTQATADKQLGKLVAAGHLISCKVHRPGRTPCFEYRGIGDLHSKEAHALAEEFGHNERHHE
jgi:predicted transcriptional regulator